MEVAHVPMLSSLAKNDGRETNEMVPDGCRRFRALSDDQLMEKSGRIIDVIVNWAGYVDSMTRATQLDPATQVKAIAQTLDPAMQKCRFCHEMVEERRRKQSVIQFSTSIQKKTMEEATRVCRKEVLKGAVSVAQFVLTREGRCRQSPKKLSSKKTYVVLNLQRDAVDPEGLLYSCDIDSLIWITKEPKFLGSLAIYTWPTI